MSVTPPVAGDIEIQPFDAARDSYEELTGLLHAAYHDLAQMGLNYVAATQDERTTRERIVAATQCLVARRGNEIVGSICYYAACPSLHHPGWYRRADVAFFGQFAVAPALHGRGIGSRLLEAAQALAAADAKTEFACDTAEAARHLVAYYLRHGFRSIGRHRWPHAVYDSVILSKRVGVAIRVAEDTESPDVLRIAHTLPWTQDAHLSCQLETGAVDVARDGDRVAGFIAWNREFFARPFVWLTVVDPGFRGGGIGSLMFAHVERACKGERLYSSANRSREKMHRFFERRGYARAGEIDLDPGDPEIFYYIDL
ncbi:MAG TPA: GNAT family N-acetyltransferase [Candidatus Cybelea sp.]|nr:GNAT family N-acetyltransferase [Candidatus Cybelea sp.]